MLKHPHIVATHPAVRWDSGTFKQFYIVETDLALSKDDPLYNEEALNDLYNVVRDYLVANPAYDSVDIVPPRLR